MTTPLADYLSALETRDAREKAHEKYINAFTKLADKTAAQTKKKDAIPQDPTTTSEPASSTTTKSSPNDYTAQIRAELASTQKTRTHLETQLAATAAELTAYKQTSAEQKKRITSLEASKAQLERRMKDREDELKGKGRFVEDVQDEMVALTLQLNMAEKESERLRKENKELTERWIRRMEEEAERMNDEMGWEDARSKVKGKGK